MTAFPPVIAGLPGGWEWIVVLIIFLMLFGRRLPGIARSLGQGITEFKKGLNEPPDAKKDADDDDEDRPRKKDSKKDDDEDRPRKREKESASDESRKAPAVDRERQ